jgi:hypothetical protein
MIEQGGLFEGTESYFCRICGRSLSNLASIRRGIGPVCAHRTGADMSTKEHDFADVHIPEPIRSGVILRREGDVAMTNVPHAVVWHSPTGFEWGYSGSGPADLALNALEAALASLGFEGPREKCYDGSAFVAAIRLHQAFKFAFIAGIPHEGGTIEWSEIETFVREGIGEIRKTFEQTYTLRPDHGPDGEALAEGVDPFEAWIGKLPE